MIFAAAWIYARAHERPRRRAAGDARGPVAGRGIRDEAAATATCWDWLAFALVAGLIAGGALSVWWLSRCGLGVHQLTRGLGDTMFYDADGRPWFRLDEQRHDVPLEEIAPDLQHAVVAIEDRRFYHHPGIDPIGVARAVVHDMRRGGRAEGGSTLTQQLARTLFLSNARTLGRKAKEAGPPLLIEQQLTKTRSSSCISIAST